MPLEESFYPQDWFAKARQDVRTVEILLREKGDAEVTGFHLQQAVEKYLRCGARFLDAETRQQPVEFA